MAGTVKTNNLQLGDSSTATQNFTLQTNVDGTAKLARGNAGATTQDILTIDAAGKVDLLNLLRSLAAEGSYTLPGGLIVKWGTCNSSTTPQAKTFPTAFPTACFAVLLTNQLAAGTTYSDGASSVSTTGFSAYNGSALRTCYYLAIGN